MPDRLRRKRRDRVAAALSPRAFARLMSRIERRIGLTTGGRVALVGAVALWVAARVVAGTAMYLAAYGIVLLLVSGYWIAPRRLALQADRTGLFPRVHEGERLAVTVSLQATRRAPPFLLTERLPEQLGAPVEVPITGLSSGATAEHTYGLQCGRRGAYRVGPLLAVSRDPLGLTQRERVVAEPFELLVHPRVELVSDRPLTRQYEDPPIRPPVSKPWPSGLEFYGLREFVQGDELRRIVWKASARMGKLMVREAEQGITDHITLILDTDRRRHSAEVAGVSESFETGVRIVASLGVKHLREGYEVRVETNGGPLVRPLRGHASQLVLLDALARIESRSDPLADAMAGLVAQPTRDAHNVVVTPHLDDVAAGRIRLLLNTGVSVLVVALQWDEEEDSTVSTAAALGCQVVRVAPGDDLRAALIHDVGAGSR